MPFTYPTVTIGAAQYTVMVSLEDADTILAADIGRAAAWAALSTDQKGQALVTGTRKHDRLDWQGEKTEADNDHDFPRTGLKDQEGEDVNSATIPEEVEFSVAYYAADVAAKPSLDGQQTTGSNIKSVEAGSTGVEFFTGTSGTRLPTTNMELVGLWLAGTGGLGGVHASGTEVCSGIEQYPRSDGFA